MRICKRCKETRIKSNKNYTHGKKSKATVTLTCRSCGSTSIGTKSNNWKNKNQKNK